jgi:hypothetical protein
MLIVLRVYAIVVSLAFAILLWPSAVLAVVLGCGWVLLMALGRTETPSQGSDGVR